MVPCRGGGDVGQEAGARTGRRQWPCVSRGRGHTPDAGTESVTGRCGENLISRPVTDPATGRGDNEPGGMALFLAGSAMGSAGTGADRFGTRFFQAMGEDRFGVRRGPAVGQHFFHIRVVRMQAE